MGFWLPASDRRRRWLLGAVSHGCFSFRQVGRSVHLTKGTPRRHWPGTTKSAGPAGCSVPSIKFAVPPPWKIS